MKEFKTDIFKGSRELRHNERFNKIFIKKDLTRKQQKQEYELWKERKEAGEDVIIFNDQVIPRKDHPKQQII